MHYESILDLYGFCPIPVMCGLNWLAKMKSAKAALSLIGNATAFYSSVKDRFLRTLPPVLDDIKSAKQIEEIAIYFLIVGKMAPALWNALHARPIITVNWETLDALDRDPR